MLIGTLAILLGSTLSQAVTAVPDEITMHRGQKASIAVLANDTGATSAVVVTQPLAGTAVATSDGRILYSQIGGSPMADSFTYRAANCAYCHQSGGTAAPAAWDGRSELTLDQTGLINGSASNNGGITLNKLVVSGDIAHSIIYNRVAVANGFTRMPALGSNELDQAGIALLTEWIQQGLPARKTDDTWRLEKLGSSTSPASQPSADPDGDGRTNQEEFLAATDPLKGTSFPVASPSVNGSQFSLGFYAPVNRSVQVEASSNLADWSLWNVPGNEGLPQPGGSVSLSGAISGNKNFFRLRFREN